MFELDWGYWQERDSGSEQMVEVFPKPCPLGSIYLRTVLDVEMISTDDAIPNEFQCMLTR
jgi:hypothetical protein